MGNYDSLTNRWKRLQHMMHLAFLKIEACSIEVGTMKAICCRNKHQKSPNYCLNHIQKKYSWRNKLDTLFVSYFILAMILFFMFLKFMWELLYNCVQIKSIINTYFFLLYGVVYWFYLFNQWFTDIAWTSPCGFLVKIF